jgi:hypothetical protein
MTPFSQGVRIQDHIITPDAFTDRQLADAMYRLTADADDAELIIESCSPEEADALLNPGMTLIAEAVSAVKNRLDRTMSALVRVFARHGDAVQPYEHPSIGPDRKNALFAYKTVTFTFDDGQTVSILFHSPGRDPMKLVAEDTLIAYRWMLNRRDITAIVSPESGRDINLQTMARRIMQLVQENSEKFQANNEKRQAQNEKLAALETEQTDQSQVVDRLTQQNADLSGQIETTDGRIERLRARLEAHGEGSREGSGAGSGEPDGATAHEGEPDGASFGLKGPLAMVRGGAGRTRALSDIAQYLEQLDASGVQFPPTSDVFMAMVDDGEQSGFSMNELYVKLSEHEQNLAALQAGRIRGDKIVGRGNGGKQAAIKWLNKKIAETRHSIETNGIGESVNLTNYRAFLHDLVRDLPEPDLAGSEEGGDSADNDRATEAEQIDTVDGWQVSHGPFVDFTLTAQSALGVDSTRVSVKARNGNTIGAIEREDVSAFTDGDTSTFTPTDSWKTTYSEELKQLLGLVDPESESVTDPDNLEAIDSRFYRDISGSIGVIRGIDNGTEQGYNRSLFTSSISNKIKTQARNGNEDVVNAALLLIAQQSIEHGRPILAKRNAIWSVTGQDMDYYTEIAQRQTSADASDNTPTPAPEEQDATPTPDDEGSEPTETDRIGAALQALLSETDSTAAIDALETLMDEAEAAGIDIDNDPNMLAASDHITQLLEQEAA